MSNPGSTLTFTYDADGNRTSKTVNGTTTTYTYADGRVTHETNGTDTIHYRYDTNGTLLSMNLNGTEYYYLYNGQRDVIGLYDASGNVVVEYTYDAWVKPLTTTGSLASTVGAKNPYRYRGYRYDAETGLYALTTRHYNAQLGRFINADGVIQVGETYQSNLFEYSQNCPASKYDIDTGSPNEIYEAFDRGYEFQTDQGVYTYEEWYVIPFPDTQCEFAVKRTDRFGGEQILLQRTTRRMWENKLLVWALRMGYFGGIAWILIQVCRYYIEQRKKQKEDNLI